MKKIKIATAIILIIAILPACTPVQNIRGNLIEKDRLVDIQEGVTTRRDILMTMGSPTTRSAFNRDIWYYIGQNTEKKGILDHKTTNQQVVKVSFDKDGIVQEFGYIDANTDDIPIDTDKTKTTGNKTNLVQEFFGNLGKFNKQ